MKCKLKNKQTTIWHPNQDIWTCLITGTVHLKKRKNCIVAGINLTLGGDLIHLSSTILHLCQGCDITYDHDVWPSGVAVAVWRKLHCIGTHTMYWQEIDTSPSPTPLPEKKACHLNHQVRSAPEDERCVRQLPGVEIKVTTGKKSECAAQAKSEKPRQIVWGGRADSCLPAITNGSATLRRPTETHAPRISQHSQMKTSRNRGSRSAVYLCLRVVRLRSSFCLLLWILLRDQRKIDIQWRVTWCTNTES